MTLVFIRILAGYEAGSSWKCFVTLKLEEYSSLFCQHHHYSQTSLRSPLDENSQHHSHSLVEIADFLMSNLISCYQHFYATSNSFEALV